MLNALPILMVRNESLWIRWVLRPLLKVFERVLVADTGSTDTTVEIVQNLVPPGQLILKDYGEQTPVGLTEVRNSTMVLAEELGYDLVLLVDGDEIYTEASLRSIDEQGFQAGKRFGFTTMLPVEKDDEGLYDYWELDDPFSRAAVYTSDTRFRRPYPRELPTGWSNVRQTRFTYELPAGARYHAVHMKRCPRSPHDQWVFQRLAKQQQLRESGRTEAVRVQKFDLLNWLEV